MPPEPPADVSWLRFEEQSLFRTFIVDVFDRYRCEVCDIVLPKRRHKCDHCKRNVV